MGKVIRSSAEWGAGRGPCIPHPPVGEIGTFDGKTMWMAIGPPPILSRPMSHATWAGEHWCCELGQTKSAQSPASPEDRMQSWSSFTGQRKWWALSTFQAGMTIGWSLCSSLSFFTRREGASETLDMSVVKQVHCRNCVKALICDAFEARGERY